MGERRNLFYIIIIFSVNQKSFDEGTISLYRHSAVYMIPSDEINPLGKHHYNLRNWANETAIQPLKEIRTPLTSTECFSNSNMDIKRREDDSTDMSYYWYSNDTWKMIRDVYNTISICIASLKADDSILLDQKNKTHCDERTFIFVFLCFIIVFGRQIFTEIQHFTNRLDMHYVLYRTMKPWNISCSVSMKGKRKSDTLWNLIRKFFTNKTSVKLCIQINAKNVGTNDTPYFCDESLKRNTLHDIIFGFKHRTNVTINVYPTSLDRYFDEVNKNDPTKRDLMKYEWERYKSLRNFPKTSVMMPMRLAQAGFFYNGLGEEVTCFCCGVRNRVWNSEETAFQVHERISPNCSFIRGKENNNVSIHNSDVEYESMDKKEHTTQNNEKHDTGASGGPDDIQVVIKEAISELEQNQITESTRADTQEINNPAMRAFRHMPSERSDKQPQEYEKYKDDVPGATNDKSTSNVIQKQKTRTESSEGLNFKCAKHPEYGVKIVRTSSYRGWPPDRVQTPEELSDAGFYYAGFQDCVRCFFCGGGLKNWEYGDSPWTEHARWYPDCAYLRHCKGESFISQHREDKQNVKAKEDTTASSGKANATKDEKHRPEEPICARNSLNGDITSVAAESVLEMGYTTVTVQHAIDVFRMHRGDTQLTAEALMHILLDGVHNHASVNNNAAPDHNTAVSTIKSPDSQCQQGTCSISNTSVSNKTDEPKPHEKSALAKEDYKSIAEENRSLREQMMCKICMDNDACIVFLPCGHMVACPECAPALRKCAICRQLIKGTIRAFPS